MVQYYCLARYLRFSFNEIHYFYMTECIVFSAVYTLVKYLIDLFSAGCYLVRDEQVEYTQTGDLTDGNNFSVA